MTGSTDDFECIIKELKEVHPKFVEIANSWYLDYQIHGGSTSKDDENVLKRFSKAMEKLINHA